MDFHRKRGMVKVETKWVDGIPLEDINPGQNDSYRAIALVNERWGSRVYFVNERASWKEDDYFELAERLLWKKGIVIP